MTNNSSYTNSEKMAALTITAVGGAIAGAMAGNIIDKAVGNKNRGFSKIGVIGGFLIGGSFASERMKEIDEEIRQEQEEKKNGTL